MKHNGVLVYPFIGLPTMNLKGAATLAFIGTLLAAALLIYDFVFDVINVVGGLTPAITLFPALIYAFAALSLAIFFFLFQKKQN
jgi:hypothetical protein